MVCERMVILGSSRTRQCGVKKRTLIVRTVKIKELAEMKIENGRRLSIVLAVSFICLGVAQWFDPSESSMRWKWLQDITSNLFGAHGHAKFLILTGVIWLIWNLIVVFGSSKGEKK